MVKYNSIISAKINGQGIVSLLFTIKNLSLGEKRRGKGRFFYDSCA